jgi:hypothetical protein
MVERPKIFYEKCVYPENGVFAVKWYKKVVNWRGVGPKIKTSTFCMFKIIFLIGRTSESYQSCLIKMLL